MKKQKSRENIDWFSGKISYLLLAILPAVIYFQTIFFDFTSFDDRILIIDNYHQINKLSFILDAFSRDVFSNLDGIFYRPLLTATFIIDAAVGGKNPSIYHLTNLILHIASVLLLFSLLKNFSDSNKKPLIFSLIFSIHPVLTQAVAWIPGRNDSLLTFFILLSALFYLRYLSAENEIKKYLNLFLLFLFFLTSLLTKESAAVFPAVILFHFFFIEREKRYKNIAYLLGAFIAAAAIWFLMRAHALQGETNLLSVIFQHNIERLHGLALYLGKIFFPLNLSPFPTYEDTTLIYSVAALIILIISVFIFRVKNLPAFLWGILWFFFFLLPSLSFAEGNIVFLEHRLYLPMAGLIIALLQLRIKERISLKKSFVYSLTFGAVIIFSAMTFIYSKTFKDGRTMWEYAEETSPSSSFVHNNLGNVYMREGETERAINQYDAAVGLKPDHAEAHLNLGYAFRKIGDEEHAENFYKKAIELRPNYAKAYNNLGNLYLSQNMYEKAEENFFQAINSDPEYFEAYSNLGSLFYKKGDADSAKNYWEKSIEINPEFAQAYYNLGVLFYNSKIYKKAGQYFNLAQELGLNVNPALLNSLKEKLK